MTYFSGVTSQILKPKLKISSSYFWIVGALLTFLGMWVVFANFLPSQQALVRAFVAFTFFSAIVVVNLRWLIPNLLPRQNFVYYAFWVMFTCAAITLIRYFLEEKLSIPVSMIRRNPILNTPLSERQKILTLFFAHSLVFLLSLTYYFGRAWFDADKREAVLKSERLETEIKFLRSQVSPHFLLNILNNIYALSYLKDDRTPTMLLKLSEMMRYLIYESNQPLVSLEKEIEFFNNYIALQKLKNKNYESLTVKITGMKSADKIPALLLLPFFENIFKHSDLETNEAGSAIITIAVNDNQLVMQTSNTKSTARESKSEHGFGLANVRHRLDLLYPGCYQLHFDDSEKFTCKLQIPLP